jgi:hypothetical protein
VIDSRYAISTPFVSSPAPTRSSSDGVEGPLRHLGAKMLTGRRPAANGEPSMGEITTIGVDLAKHVFQVHGVDAEGRLFCAIVEQPDRCRLSPGCTSSLLQLLMSRHVCADRTHPI